MGIHSIILYLKKIFLFAAVIAVVTKGMNYLYVDDTKEFARCMMHEFYEEDENIDRLYLGSSHVFSDINPAILDEMNGENNFNMATGMQQLNTSYYLLKEAGKKHHIDRVYLDLYYQCTDEGFGNVHSYQSLPPSWNVLNQMKFSANKVSYMLDLSSPKYYYMTFLPFMRYKDTFFDGNYIREIIEEKRSDRWKNYDYAYIAPDGKSIKNKGKKGFITHDIGLEYGNFYVDNEEEPVKENPISEESLEYLQKIVEYCEASGIKLTWIVCPVSDFQLTRNGQYDNYIRQVRELAERYHVPYYDFNLCRREYLDVSQKNYWYDIGHMNIYGAEVYSQFLGDFLLAQETGKDTYEDCFYSSYQEKILDSQKQIFGMEMIRSEAYERFMPEIPEEEREEYVIYRLRFVTNAADEHAAIDVSVTKDTGTGMPEAVSVIREDNDAYVIFSSHEHGKMNVRAELENMGEVSEWERIEY